MLAGIRHPEGALMAEDEPRHGEVPEHGQDPDTATPAADQPSTEPAPTADPATGPSANPASVGRP